MTNYFVSSEIGDDGNAGTAASASGAWATLQHAIDNVAAGDFIYVDPSTKGYEVYAEALVWTAAADGTAGNDISIIGDIDGTYFRNAGYVTWSSKATWGTNDDTSGALQIAISKDYWKVKNFLFTTDNGADIDITGDNITFEDVDVNVTGDATGYALTLAGADFYFNRGSILSVVGIIDGYKLAYASDAIFDNVVMIGGSISSAFLTLCLSDTATFNHCLVYSLISGYMLDSSDFTFNNCLVMGKTDITLDSTAIYNYTRYDNCSRFIPLTLSTLVNKNHGRLHGFSLLPFSPESNLGVAGAELSTGDFFGRPFKVNTIGGGTCVGSAITAISKLNKENEMTGDESIQLVGSAYHDFRIYVNSGKIITVSAKCKFDSTYDSNNNGLPVLKLLSGLGSSEKSDTHVGGAGVIDTLTVTSDVTSSDGEMIVRLETYGTTNACNVYFDEIT